MLRTLATAWPRIIGQASLGLTWAAGIAMVAMVVLIVASVVMRYLVHEPLLGSNELVQLASVVLVMAALPYCTWQDAHIRVDILDSAMGRWGRLAGDLLFRLTAIVILSLLTYRAIVKALDALRWGDVTNMLSLPVWPGYAILAAGSGLCALIFLGQIFTLLANRDQQ